MAIQKKVTKTVKTPTKKTVKAVAKLDKPEDTKVAKKAVKKTARKCVRKSKCASTKITRIIAKCNIGWGNQLFVRGDSAGLDWNKGVVLQCISEDEWIWEQHSVEAPISFKILINDEVWSDGEDFIIEAGETTICHPSFDL